MNKVLIAGYGSAGQYLVDFLMKDHRIQNLKEICIISRAPEEQVEPRLNITRVAAGLSGRYIPIRYRQCDFNNVDQLATILTQENPQIVVYTGRYASGLKYGEFSYPYDIGYGVWIPMSLPYIYNLMKAHKAAGSTAKVINTSFPDGVNYLLGQVEDADTPYCGAGNLNHLIPRIKRAVSEIFPCRIEDLEVDLACAHYVNTYVSKEGTERNGASLLNVWDPGDLYNGTYCEDEDLSHQDPYKFEIFKRCKDISASGQIRNQMIATDCAELVRLLTAGGDLRHESAIHVPGVEGRPGGQRYVITRNPDTNENELVSSSRWSQDEIFKTNLTGLYNDGIEIKESKIFFTDYSRDKMKEVYGLDYPKYLEACDAQKFADEISQKLREIKYFSR